MWSILLGQVRETQICSLSFLKLCWIRSWDLLWIGIPRKKEWEPKLRNKIIHANKIHSRQCKMWVGLNKFRGLSFVCILNIKDKKKSRPTKQPRESYSFIFLQAVCNIFCLHNGGKRWTSPLTRWLNCPHTTQHYETAATKQGPVGCQKPPLRARQALKVIQPRPLPAKATMTIPHLEGRTRERERLRYKCKDNVFVYYVEEVVQVCIVPNQRYVSKTEWHSWLIYRFEFQHWQCIVGNITHTHAHRQQNWWVMNSDNIWQRDNDNLSSIFKS